MTDRELINFEKLAQKTKEQLQASKEASADWLHQAMDKAAQQMEKAGEFTAEEAKQAKAFLKRDLAHTKEDFAKASEVTKKALNPSRVGSGFLDLASHLFSNMGDKFQDWAQKSEEALVYHTGEVTGPGTLTCSACGTQMHPEQVSKVPPCPKCHKSEFRKSY